MPFVAGDLTAYYGTVVPDGHCVAFVCEVTAAPQTSRWRRGVKVRGGGVRTHTAIATFGDDGRYANATDGSSHAAILWSEEDDGLMVWDQWVGRPVALRLILGKGGVPPACDDADAYNVIEAEDEGNTA